MKWASVRIPRELLEEIKSFLASDEAKRLGLMLLIV